MKNIILILIFNLMFYGFTVYDPANFAQNLQNQIHNYNQIQNQITSLKNEANQIVNQLKSLENEAKNLKKISSSLSSDSLQELERTLQKMLYIQDSFESKLKNYQDITKQCEEIYPDYIDSNNMSYSDYLEESKKLSVEMKATSLDSFKALNLISEENHSNNAEIVKDIMSNANDAEGQLQVLQASVQINAQTNKQLQELKYLTGQNLKLQATKFTKQEQEKTIEKQEIEILFQNNVDVESKDSGLIDDDGKVLYKLK